MTSSVQAQTNDTAWLGINASHYANLNTHLADLGIKAIRVGSGWQQSGKSDEMRYRDDAKINAFVAAGYTLHMSINYRGYDLNNKKVDVADLETWVANYKDFCRQVITKYGSSGNVKVSYYICGNEPDLNDAFTGNLTPVQAYRFSRALWEAKNEINPALTTESAPVAAPVSNFLRAMINAGVADYTDVIGIHAYSNQFDDAQLQKPWDYLAAKGKNKPVSISEAGVPLGVSGWAPAGIDENLWRTRWHQLAYVQAKRFGIDRMLLFTHTGNTDWTDKWDYRDRNNNYAPVQGAYDEVKYGMRKRTNLNGDFESDNDRWHEWVVMQPIGQASAPSWANFTSGGAYSGSRCLKISVGNEWRQVRKVVANLTIGTPYTLSTWVKMDGGGGARLKAQGYNRTKGGEETSATASGYGVWQKLTVTFTPTNPWVVLTLASTGSASSNVACYFDDVDLAQNSPTFSGTYQLFARHSGKALTVAGPSTADGANVIQYGTDSATNRQWIITATSGGYYTLKAKHSGRMLSLNVNAATNGSVDGTATGEGANVLQFGTNAPDNRQWKIEPVGDGYYKLTNRRSGRALAVAGGPTATGDGVNVHQWTYSGGTNQQWGLQQISTATSASTTSAPAASSAPSGSAS